MLQFTECCPSCGAAWDVHDVKAGKPASDFYSCRWRCESCGIAFSNAAAPSQRRRITRTPELNVPVECREGLTHALGNAVNVRNRPSKLAKACSSTSEDAVAWTAVQALISTGDLGALIGPQRAPSPEAVLVWGVPVVGTEGEALAKDLTAACDALGEKRLSRSEPDVMMLWPDLLVLVEIKYGSGNDLKANYGGYATYLPRPELFVADDAAIAAEGSYQLTRNWVIGAMLAARRGVVLRLVNLGPQGTATQARRFAALLKQSPERSFAHRTWAEVIADSRGPEWFDAFATERELKDY